MHLTCLFQSYVYNSKSVDMKSAVNECVLRLYADNTCIPFDNEYVSSVEKHLKADLNGFVSGLYIIKYL